MLEKEKERSKKRVRASGKRRVGREKERRTRFFKEERGVYEQRHEYALPIFLCTQTWIQQILSFLNVHKIFTCTLNNKFKKNTSTFGWIRKVCRNLAQACPGNQKHPWEYWNAEINCVCGYKHTCEIPSKMHIYEYIYINTHINIYIYI